MTTKLKIILSAGAVTLASSVLLFSQGSLTPPGPPGPTMKSLDQIEPRTPIGSLPFLITQPGSYYLTRDVTASGASEGITIRADDVTVDLQGFRLTGSGGPYAIWTDGAYNGITVRNGTVSNWLVTGIELGNSKQVLIENVHVRGDGNGILAGDFTAVRNCLIEGTGAASNYRLLVGRASHVVDCRVIGSVGVYGAIFAGHGAIIRNCSATGKYFQSGGRSGFGVSCLSGTLDGVTASGYDTGIGVGSPGTLRNSTVADCNIGVTTGDDAVVADCVISAGATAGTGPAIQGGERVSVTNTVTSRHSRGIQLGNTASLSRCTAASNTLGGFSLGDGATVSGCSVRGNSGDGILVAGGSVISGNTCDANSGIGINTTGFTNRIEGNTVLSSATGIRLSVSFNTVFRNCLHTANPIVDAGSGNDIAPQQTAASAANPFANIVH